MLESLELGALGSGWLVLTNAGHRWLALERAWMPGWNLVLELRLLSVAAGFPAEGFAPRPRWRRPGRHQSKPQRGAAGMLLGVAGAGRRYWMGRVADAWEPSAQLYQEMDAIGLLFVGE